MKNCTSYLQWGVGADRRIDAYGYRGKPISGVRTELDHLIERHNPLADAPPIG
jgi:hypothetical protein